jgi:hypothetical protein
MNHGELIVAHPSRVAAADQIQAAAPRKTPSSVVLSDYVTDKVFVIDLDRAHAIVFGESPWRTLRRARYARVGLRDPLDRVGYPH